MQALYQYFYPSETQLLTSKVIGAFHEVKGEEKFTDILLAKLDALQFPELFKTTWEREAKELSIEDLEKQIPNVCIVYLTERDRLVKEVQNREDLGTIRDGMRGAVNSASFYAYMAAYVYYDLPIGNVLPGNEGIGHSGYKLHSVFEGKNNLRVVFMTPTEKGESPVMIFRGTDPKSQDHLKDNFLSATIGEAAFKANAHELFDLMKAIQMDYGRLIVIGHSMGGALSQLVGDQFYPLVSELYVYNSPGVHAENLQEKFAVIHPNMRPRVFSYHHARDLVRKSGGDLLPTTLALIVGHSSDPVSRLQAHQILDLAKSLNCSAMVRDDHYLREQRSVWKKWVVDKFFEGGRYYILGSLVQAYTQTVSLLYPKED